MSRSRDKAFFGKLAICIVLLVMPLIGGCSDNFFDPTQIGRFKPVPAVNVILDSLGVADEKASEWDGAEDPKPIDIMVFENDYAFASGDVLRISIFELLNEGQMYDQSFVVTETGKISLPEIGIIEVTGLTESLLEEEIKRILSPSILKDPLVTVTSIQSERRTYSILGNGVPGGSGRFEIPRYDFRLNDALAVSGVATQFNVSYVYVTRRVTDRELNYSNGNAIQKPSQLRQSDTIRDEDMLDIIAPHAKVNRPASKMVITASVMSLEPELSSLAAPGGFENNETQENSQIEWIFQDGKWIPVNIGESKPKKHLVDQFDAPKPAEKSQQILPEQFEWDQIGSGGVQTRVIKIPTDRLAGGDPRYNIIIRPGDTIHVPVDIIGEFAIMGNVNRTGYIPLTGRKMTLKMAVAAAGGLGQLAWPKKCEVTRRIGRNKEETVMVDLEKIARGEEPDFYIKPNDLINVGTHPTSFWRAVLSTSFRATYGFSFIYDRNFADREFGLRHPLGPFGFGE